MTKKSWVKQMKVGDRQKGKGDQGAASSSKEKSAGQHVNESTSGETTDAPKTQEIGASSSPSKASGGGGAVREEKKPEAPKKAETSDEGSAGGAPLPFGLGGGFTKSSGSSAPQKPLKKPSAQTEDAPSDGAKAAEPAKMSERRHWFFQKKKAEEPPAEPSLFVAMPAAASTDAKKGADAQASEAPPKRGWFFSKKTLDAGSPPATPPVRRKKDDVDDSLSAIYEGRPTKEWMNTIDHGRQKTWLVVMTALAGIAVVALAATWAGFLWFGNHGFGGQGMVVAVEGPDQILIGQEVTYFVNWFNVSKEPLASVEHRVSFPSDFVVTEVSPTPTTSPSADAAVIAAPQTITFRLGAQPVEARGTIKITGRFTGALGTKSAVQVISTYRPASFNSDFEALVTKDISYTGSVLTGGIDVPPKVVPGDAVTFRYHVENTGNDPMPGLVVRFTLPDGFIAASGTPVSADGAPPSFPIGTLQPGASSTVDFRGAFALGTHGDQTIRAEAGMVSPDGTFAAAQSSEAPVSVLAGDLKIDLIVNGTSGDRSVNPGDTERISIAYANTSDEPLKDVVLTFHFAGVRPTSSAEVSLTDWSAFAPSGGATGTRSGNAVSFTKSDVKEFGELAPNADGSIDFSIPIVKTVPAANDVPLNAYVEAKIGSVGDAKVNRTVKTTPIVFRIRSDAAVDAAARYSSDEGIKLGAGPLPPVVGSSTTYRIEWHVTKTLHELSRLTVSATLPPGVAYGSAKEVGAGDVGYDPEKKLVTWQVNRMPADVGDLLASFDVVLVPTESDVGRFASLLGETRLEFTDAVLSESVLRTSPALSTELPDDALAKKKGVVSK
jgi:uncharacterized repeat protein (TIGR01451 family)